MDSDIIRLAVISAIGIGTILLCMAAVGFFAAHTFKFFGGGLFLGGLFDSHELAVLFVALGPSCGAPDWLPFYWAKTFDIVGSSAPIMSKFH